VLRRSLTNAAFKTESFSQKHSKRSVRQSLFPSLTLFCFQQDHHTVAGERYIAWLFSIASCNYKKDDLYTHWDLEIYLTSTVWYWFLSIRLFVYWQCWGLNTLGTWAYARQALYCWATPPFPVLTSLSIYALWSFQALADWYSSLSQWIVSFGRIKHLQNKTNKTLRNRFTF
jgi:hypothetical protein